MRLVPIDSTKNVVQFGNSAVASLNVSVTPLALAVKPGTIDETDAAKVNNVEQGCMLRGFELGIRIYSAIGNDGIPGKVVAFIRKNEGGRLAAPSLAMCNSIGSQNWKNRVFHMISMIADGPAGLPLGLNGIKIPKRFHKMEQDDVWELVIANNNASQVYFCGYAIYKWYR